MAANDCLGCDWENSVFRNTLVKMGEKEALRIFDEEQERMRREAEEEIAEMKKRGEIL